jgi:hypothetical protein
MAFARQQGKTIRVLQSRRVGKSVKQEQLHCFHSFDEAWRIVNSPIRWKSTAMAMLLRQNKDHSRLPELQKVKAQIEDILEKQSYQESLNTRLGTATVELKEVLSDMQEYPLTEPSFLALSRVKKELSSLEYLIGRSLSFLENMKDGVEPYRDDTEQAADDLLDEGMEHYHCGDWRSAQSYYLAGLEVDSSHIDLNVHAGLCCLQADQDVEALEFFDKAYTLGLDILHELVRDESNDYMYYSDFEKRWRGVTILTDDELEFEEHEEWERMDLLRSQKEEDAGNVPCRGIVELRPLFRAASDKIVTLQKLNRHEEAVRQALEIRDYWGADVADDISYSYLCMEEYESADHWSSSSPGLQRALIKLMLGDKRGFIDFALTAINRDPVLTGLVAGAVQPNPCRVYGENARFDPLQSATNEYLDKPVYSSNPTFHIALRYVAEHAAVNSRFDGWLRENLADVAVTFDRALFDVEERDCLVEQLLLDWVDTNNEYWLPDAGSEINVSIVERKQTHWIVQISDRHRQFHYRLGGNDKLQNADTGVIAVSKAWLHRGRLYVTGEFRSENLRTTTDSI